MTSRRLRQKAPETVSLPLTWASPHAGDETQCGVRDGGSGGRRARPAHWTPSRAAAGSRPAGARTGVALERCADRGLNAAA